ncbi:MAG: hypothetical protein ABSF81_07720 [Bacteroidales bacterium]
MKNHFSMSIPCKKFVKVFLENNCGDPVDLTHIPELHNEFRFWLKKKSQQSEILSEPTLTNYSDRVTLTLPLDWLYRYGSEINRRNIMKFNLDIERRLKLLMRQYVSLNNSFGVPIACCIREFQDKFEFPESIWIYESIKKEFNRHGEKVKLNTIQSLQSEINKILLKDLSDRGIISKKLIKLC